MTSIERRSPSSGLLSFAVPDVQDLSRFRLPIGFRGRSAFTAQLWWLVQGSLFRASPDFMVGWRAALLRLFGARIGRGVRIRPTVRVRFPWRLVVGDHAWIGDDVELYSLGDIVIGANAVVSQRSYLCTGTHDYRDPGFAILAKPIFVEAESWICTDVFVGPGVTVGQGAIIAARSTLLEDAQPMMIYAGSPARPVKPRTPQMAPGPENPALRIA